MTTSTELARDFCDGIGPLQLGVVLVLLQITLGNRLGSIEFNLNADLTTTIFECQILGFLIRARQRKSDQCSRGRVIIINSIL